VQNVGVMTLIGSTSKQTITLRNNRSETVVPCCSVRIMQMKRIAGLLLSCRVNLG